MSFFESIKGTFNSVQRELGVGFKAFTGEPTRSRQRFKKQGVNLDAGASLLQRYQAYWQEIHVDLETNAAKAKQVDEKVSAVKKQVTNEHKILTEFSNEISTIPQITETLQDVMKHINALTEQLAGVENVLLTLEDVCEQQEMVQNQHAHTQRYTTYCRTKQLDLEKAKVQLSRQHAQQVQAFEQKLQRNLKERQQAFEATYQEEIQAYKATGHTSLKPNLAGSGPSLSEIVVEPEDKAALDAFLEPQNETNGRGYDENKNKEEKLAENTASTSVPDSADTNESRDQSKQGSEVKDDQTEQHVEIKADQDISTDDIVQQSDRSGEHSTENKDFIDSETHD